MKFLIVVPTVRQSLPGFDDVMSRLRNSFTEPTELHILDGSAGKPATLNYAYDTLLSGSDCDVYVTMDDDYIPGKNWESTLAAGFDALPEIGALGIWMGDAPDILEYVGAWDCGPIEVRNGVQYRRIAHTHHIAGCMIAFRREVAIGVGKLPDCDLKYQIWEDAYRGRRVRLQGKELAFVVGDLPHLFPYSDPAEYVHEKTRELEIGRAYSDHFLAQGGIRDPLQVRLRRKAGDMKRRLLGR